MRFRPMAREDVATLHRWLNDPAVVRWWEGDDVSLEQVRRDYGPDTDDAHVEHWIAEQDGSAIGWVQCYPATGEDEESKAWRGHLDLTACGAIDYLVGDAPRGEGWGARMLAAFAEEVGFGRHPEWQTLAASPYLGNRPSWRALAKAGFVHVADLSHDGPGGDGTHRDDGPLRLMSRRRDGSGTQGPPRLVATDLDGTLLDAEGRITERTRAVLRALDDRGVPVVFVTGRPLRWMTDLWRDVGSVGLAIVSNGAVTYDVAAHEVLHVHGIDARVGVDLAARITAEEPSARFAIECLDGIRVAPGFADDAPRLADAPRGELAEIWTTEALKILVRSDEADDETLRAAVERGVGDRAHPTWSMPGLVEVSAAGVTKAAALTELCRDRGVSLTDVVAFGDMPNDLPMLRVAGLSYAMPHSLPEVKDVADRVAASNTEDGVAGALIDLFALDI